MYHYADVMEKWKNIKFVSEKEKKEMENNLANSLNIIKHRRKENRRKLTEKRHL